jgi:hypothetical protein
LSILSTERLEAFCRDLAGTDLGQLPLYIVPQSTLPPQCGSGNDCYGYFTPSLDLYLRDHIPNFRGRGPCMVINDVALREDYNDEDLDYVTHACVLHELAHILDRPLVYPEPVNVDPQKLIFEALVVAKATGRPARVEVPRYYGHEVSFIRIALHLVHRAQQLGVAISPAAVYASHRYGVSHISEYLDALGNEPTNFADRTIRQIVAEDPPRAFAELWNSDLVAYQQRFSQRSSA